MKRGAEKETENEKKGHIKKIKKEITSGGAAKKSEGERLQKFTRGGLPQLRARSTQLPERRGKHTTKRKHKNRNGIT